MLGTIRQKIRETSRNRKQEQFYGLCPDGSKVLDVGVASEGINAPPARNHFLKSFRYNSSLYTGLGIEDLRSLEGRHPGKRFVRYDGKVFPFSDKEFDWCYSNAVIEHVGGDEDHLFFLEEMMRVGRNVFFTTPNKLFPIETHTNIPFLHWNDSLFYRWLAEKDSDFDKENLSLYTYWRLKSLLEQSSAKDYRIICNRLFGWTMTFSVVCCR